MRARYLTLMTVVAVMMTGCFAGKVLHVYGKAYSNTVGRLVPTLPRGNGQVSADVRVADASELLGACATCSEPRPLTRPVEDDNEPAEQEAPPARASQPAYRDTTPIAYTEHVTRAPSYPSSPFIAIYPASKGSSAHLCKQFTQSEHNKDECMTECRAQMISGPGSCSCNEMERCPEGVRVVR